MATPIRRRVSDESAVTVQQLSCGMHGTVVLADLTHTFMRGGITAVTGRSGSGKTTLLRTLAGTASVIDGRMHWPTSSRSPHAAFFSVEVPFALHCSLDELIPGSAQVEALELREFRARPLGTLSGGQRQRAIIALALAHTSPVILLDEPTTALDDHSVELVLDAIVRSDKTFVIATHDARIEQIATETLQLA